MNQVIITGRLTRDIELRQTSNSKTVTTFSIAVNNNWKSADFFDCVAWGKTAENMTKYLHKGSKVCVRGRLSTRSYEKDGRNNRVTEITADEVEFLDTKADEHEVAFTPTDDKEELPF